MTKLDKFNVNWRFACLTLRNYALFEIGHLCSLINTWFHQHLPHWNISWTVLEYSRRMGIYTSSCSLFIRGYAPHTRSVWNWYCQLQRNLMQKGETFLITFSMYTVWCIPMSWNACLNVTPLMAEQRVWTKLHRSWHGRQSCLRVPLHITRAELINTMQYIKWHTTRALYMRTL